MFTGLCAFPLTPFHNEQLDVLAFEKLMSNLVTAKVEAICAMGSTGLYPYLDADEWFAIAERAVAVADNTPVMLGIGALRTRDVLKRAEMAQKAGAKAVLLAPVSYHPLSDEEVYSLYQTVSSELTIPMCVYENPRVTNFSFSDELYAKIAVLPNVAAIKIPGSCFGSADGQQRLADLRNIMPATLAIGVSGDPFGAAGMQAGCDLWLSVLAGLFPQTVQNIIGLARSSQPQQADELSASLAELWHLFAQYNGGIRVMAAAADILGYTEANCLPAPLQSISFADKQALSKLLQQLQLS